ncbi:MAG: MFS transporter [Planctomycetaceae bacterium]|nr:MFS transporter [Planctomycetaceae bacterium]
MSSLIADQPTKDRQRYWLLLLMCLVAAIAYVQRSAMSVPAARVASDLKFMDFAWQMGLVQSAWYWSYALMQLPGGWVSDRLGSRRALNIFCLAWSFATLCAGFATGFASLIVIWGLMGAMQAGAFPAAAKAIGDSFSDRERARASGLLAAGMAIGGAIAPMLSGVLLQWLVPVEAELNVPAWRLLLGLYCLPGIAWVVLHHVSLPKNAERQASSKPAVWRDGDLFRLVTNRSMWLLCSQQFFRAAGMVFFLTWFPAFLQETRGVAVTQSGILTTIAGIGGVVGSLTGGFVSDWLYAKTGNARLSRQGLAVAGMSCCAVLIVLSYFAADVRTSITLIAVGAFCATFGGVSGYTVAIGFGGRRVATVFSSMNMCGNFGAALFPVSAGWLVARTGNWNLILFLFAGIMAIDAICWALLNPRGTLFGDEDEAG